MDNSKQRPVLGNSMEHRKILEYFHECSSSIEESNRYMLRKSCMYISMCLIVMIFLANIIVSDFRLSLAHILLVPLLIIYFLINLYTSSHPIKSAGLSDSLCLIFYFTLFVLFILRDMTSSAQHQAMWFPLYLAVFPTVYIARMYKYGLFEGILILIFCTASYYTKPADIFHKDIYLSLAAYVLSMLSAHIILEVRAEEGLALKELTRISTIDKLTFLLNKGAFLSATNSYFERRKPGEPCGMCIIDVDDFKDANDNFGHDTGDKLLSGIGELLRKNFRHSDYMGRFGGDEFIVFMPGLARLDIVEMRCRSMQIMLADLDFGTSKPFTLSIGAIVDTGDHSMNEIFRMTDDALYQSKLMGKNCVSAWVIPKTETFEKPLILLASSKDNPRASLLIEGESERYSIIETHSGDTALTYLSQYHDSIRLAVIDLDIEKISGDQVVHYIKDRAGFNHIPVIAVATDEDSFVEAQNAGADKVFFTTDKEERFKAAISDLMNR